MTTAVMEAPQASAQAQADLVRLDELLRAAKADHDAFEALKRKGAAVVFRCGGKLIEAREIAKVNKIGWYSKLDEFGIAESTARQAIDLWQQATVAGYTDEDFEGKGITEAKVDFRVIKPPAQREEERRRKAEEEARRKAEEEARHKETQAPPPPPPASGDEAGERQTQEEPEWGKIDLSELLLFRQRQLDEEALQSWNARREQPFGEDYLLVLLDLGVLSVEGGQVCYLPDQDNGREEMVAVLGDKLAPILVRWATPDDLQVALKSLVFTEEPEPESKPVRKQGRRSKGGRRS